MAVTSSQGSGGFLIHSADQSMYFRMPAMEALERSFEESLEWTHMANLEDVFDSLID